MSDNLVNRLRWAATLGDLTTTSARNLMEEAAARIAELEAALQKKGCARDQKTTQYCAEVISRDARIVELEAALRQIEYLDRPQVRGLPRRKPIQEIARAALEGGKE